MASDGQESAGAEQSPLFSLALRGGSLDLWPDRIMLGLTTYPLGELVQAALVPYPADAPGALALGVLLRTRDGRAPLLIPEDPASAQRFLDIVYARRPDLRMPPPSFPSPYPPQYAARPGQPPHPSGIPQSERVWALLSHLSVFFIPLWFPLIVWLVTQQTMPYASRQAKQAFFFHLIIAGVALLLILPPTAFILISAFSSPGSITVHSGSTPALPFPRSYFLGFLFIWLLAVIVEIISIAFGIYGAVQSYQGKPFHYPLLVRL